MNYLIEGPWRGKLCIVNRPRGGDWLDEDLLRWKNEGLTHIVSLLTPGEVSELGLSTEADSCRRHDIDFESFPIRDREVPDSRSPVLQLVEHLSDLLDKGENVALHCRQGIGRSSLIAASLFAIVGIDPSEAFGRITAARGLQVPETKSQLEWVNEFARWILAMNRLRSGVRTR